MNTTCIYCPFLRLSPDNLLRVQIITDVTVQMVNCEKKLLGTIKEIVGGGGDKLVWLKKIITSFL